MGLLFAAKKTELPDGHAKVVIVNGRRIALCNVGGQFYAIEDRCSHDNGPLGEGTLSGKLLECPRHGAQFDVTTGKPVTLPAVVPVRRYEVKIQGDDLLVEIPHD
ncbi:MAG: non-heme iron oxygenase ferredoxin subunit [Candidatus Omnitrophica bacterium]|nr:non-heme iron oxygenase ferredoxin subunit [Candidatus Omnitrophota bacterium]